MERTVLGRTGLEVSRLAMGGLFVSSGLSDYEQARGALHRAVELGVNYVDTAPGYSDSEAVLGKALADVDAPLVLSTKFGGRPHPFDARDADALRASFEESCRLLGRERIDLMMIHEPDRPGQYDWWTDWEDLHGPVLDVLGELKAAGRIGFLGLGGTTAYTMAHIIRSGKFDVVLTAFNYSLLWREAAIEVIPAAVEQNMGIIAGSALQQGALARKYEPIIADRPSWLSPPRWEQFRRLYEFVDECGMPLAELAIRFVLSDSRIHTVLMGARSAEEVEKNVAATEKGPLPADVLSRLDEIAALVPFRPFEEPFGMGWLLANPANYRGPGQA